MDLPAAAVERRHGLIVVNTGGGVFTSWLSPALQRLDCVHQLAGVRESDIVAAPVFAQQRADSRSHREQFDGKVVQKQTG